MDRLPQFIKPLDRPPARRPCNIPIESALFSSSSQEATCALFAPLHYEPGYAYPLLVWLHGPGADESQLTRVMPQVSIRNFVAVAPRGFSLPGPGSSGREGYGWWQSEQFVQGAEQRIFESIERARQKLHVARGRVFLAGFDCGGTMAFRVAMSHPNRFGGVLSLCGAFPGGGTPLGNLAEARRLPAFLAVGRHSREYPAAQVCNVLRLFHAGGLSITLRQYPCGHQLAPQMLADMNRWIIEQITSAGASAEASDRPWSGETA